MSGDPGEALAFFTVLKDDDMDAIEAAVLTIFCEWKKGEHKAPKRFEIHRA